MVFGTTRAYHAWTHEVMRLRMSKVYSRSRNATTAKPDARRWATASVAAATSPARASSCWWRASRASRSVRTTATAATTRSHRGFTLETLDASASWDRSARAASAKPTAEATSTHARVRRTVVGRTFTRGLYAWAPPLDCRRPLHTARRGGIPRLARASEVHAVRVRPFKRSVSAR